MSTQVDALTVMRAASHTFRTCKAEQAADEMAQARDEVFDLIEAADKMLTLASGLAGGVSMSDNLEAIGRLSAALAAIRSGEK